jgi:hypothetical protein
MRCTCFLFLPLSILLGLKAHQVSPGPVAHEMCQNFTNLVLEQHNSRRESVKSMKKNEN